jgi:hypothetical protein
VESRNVNKISHITELEEKGIVPEGNDFLPSSTLAMSPVQAFKTSSYLQRSKKSGR